MKVLVTGSNGYIGSHVCKSLCEYGYYVDGCDIDVHGEYNNVNRYLNTFIDLDVRDIIYKLEYDCVVHLAGLAAVEKSMARPWDYYHTNITGTKNIVDNISNGHIIFASTSSAWEMASPYARSKVAAEDVIKESAENYTIFRFFNVSGTGGEFCQLGPATHLIRIAAEVAAGKRESITVFGTDYDTRDGTCIRDYVHVSDLTSAIVKAVKQGPMRTPYECLGSNRGWTVLEVIDAMRKVTGHDIPVILGDRRPGDAVASVVDELSDLIQLEHTIEDMCLSQYNLEKSRQ